MTLITSILAIIASLVIIRTRPLTGLLVYCASLLWYPQYLTLKIGTIDFSLARTVVLVLLAVVIFRDKLHLKFRWRLMDTVIVVFVVAKLISISQNELFRIFIEREGGSFFDTALVYFLARMIITSKAELLYFLKGLVFISVPIALFGMYQSVTGHNVYSFAQAYNAFREGSQQHFSRHGFYRADVTFGQYIAYGMYFAALVPISVAVFNRKRKVFSSCLTAIMVGGVLSSMSSGPYFSLAISAITLLIFPFRGYWKVILIACIVFISFLEFYSNRTWYEALTRFAFSSNTAYYRVALIDEALHGGMDGNWLTGYGYVGINEPYNSRGKYWDWEHQDMTNIYIQILAQYGLLGLVPFLMININYYKQLLKGYRKINRNDSWVVWCFFAALFGWNIAMQTVGLLAQNNNMFYIFIGLCTNYPIYLKYNADRQTQVISQ